MDSTSRMWELYERHAELWTQLRPPGLTVERAWLDRFSSLLPPAARVLDIGCGHGQPIGAHLLDAGFDVWGIDRAASLIDQAATNLPTGTWRVADMTSFTLDQTFAGFVMWHSFFHLAPTEQQQVLPLVAAHAAPGAVLLFTTGPNAGSSPGEFGGEVLEHHSLDPAEYTDLLAASGFAVVDHRVADPDCGNATVWLAVSSTDT